MSNWTSITEGHLKAAGHGAIVDKARSIAVGDEDPVSQAIADAVAQVRGAITSGNALDLDTSKVPNSLRGRVVRMALYALMERIRLPLTEDQKDQRRNDDKYLLRISEQKLRFETPDQAAGSGEMQSGGGIETASSSPRNQYTREGMAGL